MPNLYNGVDEIRDSQGRLFTNLGFGQTQDWEVIERRVINASIAAVEVAFDPTLYDEVEWSIYEARPVVNGAGGRLRVSTDGGSTFISTAGAYSWAGRRFGTTSDAQQGNATATEIDLEGFDVTSNTAGGSTTFRIRGFGLGNSSLNSIFEYSTSYSIVNAQYVVGAGVHESAAAVDALQFRFDNGNVASCISVLRGRRKQPQTFGGNADWVVIDRTELSAASTHSVFWDDQVYDEIEVTAMGMTVGTDARDILVRLSTDGSTFISGATDYSGVRHDANTTSDGISSLVNLSSFQGILSIGTAANEMGDMHMRITNVSNTTQKKMATWSHSGKLSDGLYNRGDYSGQMTANNDSIRGIQLFGELSATFSGLVIVRGRRKTAQALTPNDWEVIERQVLTSTASTITFTDIPASEFEEFELAFQDVDTDTTANNMQMQFSANNGTSYDTGSNYMYSLHNQASESSTYAELVSAAAAAMFMSANFGSTSVRKLHGAWRIGPLDSGSRKHIWGQSSHINDSGNLHNQVGSGMWFGTGSDGTITAFRLGLAAGGNFEAGSRFVLRGRRKGV